MAFVMNVLNISNISKKYNEKEVLKDISFHVNKSDRLAVVGINGSGKTTLFNIITGKIQADEGTVIIPENLKVGTIDQFRLKAEYDRTIYEDVLSEKAYILDLFEKIKKIENRLSETHGDELNNLVKKHGEILHELETINAYSYESEVKGIIRGVGYSDYDMNRKISTLSGGEKTRVELAKLLLSKPDIILLDEPTNHLDIDSVQWLENYLINLNATIVLISHDRYFIDKVCNKVLEIKNTKAEIYKGNYSEYIVKSDERYKARLKEFEKQQDYIEKQKEIIARFRRYGSEKYIKKAKSREKLLEHINIIDNPYEAENSLNFNFSPEYESGKDVLCAHIDDKHFENKKILINADIDIKKGETIALVGANGCGKSTLLKILIGEDSDFKGKLRYGSKVKIGYFDQNQEDFNYENTIFDEIREYYPHMIDGDIRKVLAKFGFFGEDVFKQIKNLSGGERARVKLCILFLDRPNFLILDEPTNHLDISTKESLEDLILEFGATVIFVSHDRYFINRVAQRTISFENYKLVSYLGDYDYYVEKKQDVNVSVIDKSEESIGAIDWKEYKKAEADKRKQKNRIKSLNEKYEKLEKELEVIAYELNSIENATNYVKLSELDYKKIEIEECMLEILSELESYEQ